MDTRRLSPEILAAIHLMLGQINRMRQDIYTLEGHVRALVAKDTEIDLEDEHWSLDISSGTLTRKEPESHGQPDQP